MAALLIRFIILALLAVASPAPLQVLPCQLLGARLSVGHMVTVLNILLAGYWWQGAGRWLQKEGQLKLSC